MASQTPEKWVDEGGLTLYKSLYPISGGPLFFILHESTGRSIRGYE
jgi:hypothetical protein